jgi:hypothetical protein
MFKFAVGVCKWELNVVLILWISEFDLYWLIWFLAMSNKREKVCCDFNGRIFGFVDN